MPQAEQIQIKLLRLELTTFWFLQQLWVSWSTSVLIIYSGKDFSPPPPQTDSLHWGNDLRTPCVGLCECSTLRIIPQTLRRVFLRNAASSTQRRNKSITNRTKAGKEPRCVWKVDSFEVHFNRKKHNKSNLKQNQTPEGEMCWWNDYQEIQKEFKEQKEKWHTCGKRTMREKSKRPFHMNKTQKQELRDRSAFVK